MDKYAKKIEARKFPNLVNDKEGLQAGGGNFLYKKFLFLFLWTIAFMPVNASSFKVVVLGCQGGPYENNMSCYLVASSNAPDFIALDAGTLLHGIHVAQERGSFSYFDVPPQKDPEKILQDHVHAYLLSHTHLDHVAGLIVNSQADSKKSIYALPSTIQQLHDHLFNWKIWPNFGDAGPGPLLNKYRYVEVEPDKPFILPKPSLVVEVFALSHPGSHLSSAFLLKNKEDYLLYVGDTSSDALEKEKRLFKIWQRLAPEARQGKLKGIFIECSYNEGRMDEELYGHLKPRYLIQELKTLASLTDPMHPQSALKGLKVVITHIKPDGIPMPETILHELESMNDMGIEFLLPEQGGLLLF